MMRKQKIILLLSTLLAAGIPMNISADNDIVEPSAEFTSVVVEQTGNKLTVSHAEGSILEIFSLTGAKLFTMEIESDVKTIDLNLKKGCYILKVGNVVRKISVC